MRKIVKKLGIMVCFGLIFTGCQSNSMEEQAKEIVEVFSNGNTTEISKKIGLIDETSTIDDSFLDDVFERTEVELDSIDNESVTYIVESPDMSDFFVNNMDRLYEMNELEMEQFLQEYILSAETKEHTVTLKYTIENDSLMVDYTSTEFINAITGGLLEAYSQLYEQMILDYEEYLSEEE